MKNALKAFVVAISMLFFAATASAASVVNVSVVPGQFVGLTSAGYFAGIFKLRDSNGKEYLAMNDIMWSDAFLPVNRLDGSSYEANLYTQDDILGGAPVVFASSLYSKAAPFFFRGLLGYSPADPLWAASFNEMAMNTMNNGGPSLWNYSNQIYDQQTGAKLIDVYNSMLPNLDGNFNYRGSMVIIKYSQMTGEYIGYALPTPVPPAIWLFGGGLLGLIAVARRKTVIRV